LEDATAHQFEPADEPSSPLMGRLTLSGSCRTVPEDADADSLLAELRASAE
jgi:hypothetical protein